MANRQSPDHAETRNINLLMPLVVLLALLMTVAGKPAAAEAQKALARVNGTVLNEADLQEALNEIMPAGVFHGGFSSEKGPNTDPRPLKK